MFYNVSMAVLGFPRPLALGVAGGLLEFVPVIGWIAVRIVRRQRESHEAPRPIAVLKT
jgi:hypothetical protein